MPIPSRAWMVLKTNETTWAHIVKELTDEDLNLHKEELTKALNIMGDPNCVNDLEKQREAKQILDDICLQYHIWID